MLNNKTPDSQEPGVLLSRITDPNKSQVRDDPVEHLEQRDVLDKQTLKLIHDIEELDQATKDKLLFLANAVIRDAKTGKAYSQ